MMPAVAYWDFVSVGTAEQSRPISAVILTIDEAAQLKARQLDGGFPTVVADGCVEESDLSPQMRDLIAGGAALKLSPANLALLVQHFHPDVRGLAACGGTSKKED